MQFAVEFAKRHDSRLFICTVTTERMARLERAEPDPPSVDANISVEDAGDRFATDALARAEKVVRAAGVRYELVEIYGRNTAAAIAKEAYPSTPTTSLSARPAWPSLPPACWAQSRRTWSTRTLSSDGGQVSARAGSRLRHGEVRGDGRLSLPQNSHRRGCGPALGWVFLAYLRRDRTSMQHMLDAFLSVFGDPFVGRSP